jgi:valyl-tRNA synthetase
LDMCLRLLHPFTPFVTEELWGHLRKALLGSPLADLAKDWPQALIVAPWPEPRPEEGWEEERAADFALIQEIVRTIRNLRAEQNVKPGRRIPATIVGGGKTGLLKDQAKVMAALAYLDETQVTILKSLPTKPENNIALVAGATEIYLPLAGLADPTEERARLEKELAEVQSQIDRLEKLLGSDFAGKAPAPVVQKEREKLAAYQETSEKLKAQLG